MTFAIQNNDPVLSAIESSGLSFGEGVTAARITKTLAVEDLDSSIQSATASITSGYEEGEDVLQFVTQNGISGSFNSSTGVLTLTGTTTAANYQAALRSIVFANTTNPLTTGTRTVSFLVNDGLANSNAQTRDIVVSEASGGAIYSIARPIASGAF